MIDVIEWERYDFDESPIRIDLRENISKDVVVFVDIDKDLCILNKNNYRIIVIKKNNEKQHCVLINSEVTTILRSEDIELFVIQLIKENYNFI